MKNYYETEIDTFFILVDGKDKYGIKIYIDLESLLKAKGISKNKLCNACGLQRTQLNNYCKNKVSRIDLAILAKLCDFLGCTPNDILKTISSDRRRKANNAKKWAVVPNS